MTIAESIVMNTNARPAILTQEKAASLERLARARLFAYNQKRTLPPRINPVGIMLLILTAGIIFIGLTITIVANWPGLASIGENRLKIAGPVILALGFLGCVVTAATLCWWVSRQNLKWEMDMTETARKYLNSSQSQEPLTEDNQYSMGQKKARQPGEHAMVMNHPNAISRFNRESTTSPNPSDSFESKDDDAVPNPVRVQKKRSGSNKGYDQSKGSSNLSFSAGEGDMSIPGVSFGSSPRGSIQPTNGFVKSPKSRSPVYGNDNEIERYSRMIKTTTTTRKVTRGDDDRRHGGVDPIRGALDRGMSNYDRPDRALRVLIKANSNTAVHITPSTTPTTGGHPTRISMDTEI